MDCIRRLTIAPAIFRIQYKTVFRTLISQNRVRIFVIIEFIDHNNLPDTQDFCRFMSMPIEDAQSLTLAHIWPSSGREVPTAQKAQKARSEAAKDEADSNEVLKVNIQRENPFKVSPILARDDQLREKEKGRKLDTKPVGKKIEAAQVVKRAPRVPRPPPKPSPTDLPTTAPPSSKPLGKAFPPPPPPPRPRPPAPPSLPGGPPRPPVPPGSNKILGPMGGGKIRRAPGLVEFYHSLMNRESKKETSSTTSGMAGTGDARTQLIGELESRSSYMLAVKDDVETQGDFVRYLAHEVKEASFAKMDDLTSFVQWLDEELSFLVDERAVLKHFDWPEVKADTFRDAAFVYQNLVKLEKQASAYVDNPNLPCEAALKAMHSLFEKVEQGVYAFLRNREVAISRYKEFGIPTAWLLDSGIVSKIKLSCVVLAGKFMKRIIPELDALSEQKKEPIREALLLKGVRFAFRVHQLAGGFDEDGIRAFEELKNRAQSIHSDKNRT